MTAEIAILNKEAIALASDSAVTMMGQKRQKIKTSANKLFLLSKYHPVGIMVYGNATFMEIPWETIIKIFRKNLGKQRFDSLRDYSQKFIGFLDNGNYLFPESIQKAYFRESVIGYFTLIKQSILKNVHSIFDSKGEVTSSETSQVIEEIVREHFERFEKVKNIATIPQSFNVTVIKKYTKDIEGIVDEVFEKLPLSRRQKSRLEKIASGLFSKFPENIKKQDISGVVIAGFGEKDTFPAIESFSVEGIVNDKLKFRVEMSERIDFDNGALVIPFAQSEMVAVFMEGIDPTFKDLEKSYIAKLLEDYTTLIVDNLDAYDTEKRQIIKTRLLSAGKNIWFLAVLCG